MSQWVRLGDVRQYVAWDPALPFNRSLIPEGLPTLADDVRVRFDDAPGGYRMDFLLPGRSTAQSFVLPADENTRAAVLNAYNSVRSCPHPPCYMGVAWYFWAGGAVAALGAGYLIWRRFR